MTPHSILEGPTFCDDVGRLEMVGGGKIVKIQGRNFRTIPKVKLNKVQVYVSIKVISIGCLHFSYSHIVNI